MLRRCSWLAGLFLLGCCGYSVKALLPPHLKTIAVLPVENQTIKPSLDIWTDSLLRREFERDGTLRMVDLAQANIALRCQITGYDKSPLTYTGNQEVTTWRFTVSAKVDAQDQVKSAKLWEGPVSAWVSSPATDPEETGIKQALAKLASDVVRRTLVAW